MHVRSHARTHALTHASTHIHERTHERAYTIIHTNARTRTCIGYYQRYIGLSNGKKTFRFGTLAIPFTPLCQCISSVPSICWVYARGSKISHQSAVECVTVVDSTSHSKKPQKCVYAAEKRCPALNKEEEEHCRPTKFQSVIFLHLNSRVVQ